jgi:uncharacterized repeat protein (TIGR01451 family)
VPSPLPSTDLAIQGPGLVQAVHGETIVYTLTMRNNGPAPATGIVLTDVLPPGLIPLWTQPAYPECGRQGRSVSCDAGDLREGDALTMTLDLSVGGAGTAATGGQLAGVTWSPSQPLCAIDRGSTASIVTCRLARLQPGAGMNVRLGVGVDRATTGALVHDVSVVANEADVERSNNHATVTLTLGAEDPVPSESPRGIAALASADLVVHADGPVSVIAGEPFTYTYAITNRGALDATGVRFENVVPPATILDAYAPALPRCRQRDDALLCSLRDPDSGATITFTMVITGHAGQPMELGLDPLMPGWPVCTVLKEKPWLHIVTCELGTLRPGQATHVQLTFIATGVNERMMTNTASVGTNDADANPSDNLKTATIAVQVRADVSLWSSMPAPVVGGETLSYTLAAGNLGPSDADVVLTDTLPVGVRFVSAASSRGDDCRAERDQDTGGTLVCKLGRLSGGETATVRVLVEVDESLTMPGEILHSTGVVAKQADPNPDNNQLTQVIPVTPEADD